MSEPREEVDGLVVLPHQIAEVQGYINAADAAFSHEAHAAELAELAAIKRWVEHIIRLNRKPDYRRAAGLEGDGLVVLRYEGDAVTVAGRLEEKPIQWVADEPMPTLYQIVETGNPWGISTLESQPVVPHRCQACFGTRRGQYEETCWKCKGTGLLFRGATSPTPSIQPTAPPSPRSAQ
jgi:hypothetical protein